MRNGYQSAQKDALKLLSSMPTLGMQNEKSGYLFAPTPPGLTRLSGVYFDTVQKRLIAQQKKSAQNLTEQLKTYAGKIAALKDFVEFLDEYDCRSVIPTTTALSVRAPTHWDLDEWAPLTVERSPSSLTNSIVESVMSDWRRSINKTRDEKVKLALPAHTNLGWPFLFADNGSLRPFVLGAMALYVNGLKERKNKLTDVYNLLAQRFGRPRLFQNSRLQHVGKIMPMLNLHGGPEWCLNFEPRLRSIYMGSKLGIIWNREPTKRLLKAAMSMPQHNQDRSHIQKTLTSWMSDPRYNVFAVDVSKFDKGHGGRMLKMFCDKIGLLLGEDVGRDFLAEVTMPMVAVSQGIYYESTSTIAPQLPSGVSFTTVCGLFFGDILSREILMECGVTSDYGTHYLNWGDDIVVRVPRTSVPSAKRMTEILSLLSKRIGLAFDIEPVVRYLGFNYGNGTYETRNGYSIGRLILKQFLPERKKLYPFSTIGYIARLNWIPDAESFHVKMSASWWNEVEMGPVFLYKDRNRVLQECLIKARDMDKVDLSVLDFLLHGLDPEDRVALSDEMGVDFDFEQWIGGPRIELMDPLNSLSEIDSSSLFREAVPLLKQTAFDDSGLFRFALWIGTRFNVRSSPNDVMF